MYTILVVDDSPMIVDVFVTMLGRGGYKSIAALSGAECLETLKSTTPDLILLDVMMEPMDGWETLEKIKADPETRNIPVLMLTAKPLTPEEANRYGAYIEDYILKPTTHHQLCEAIEHVLARQHSISADIERAREAGVDQQIIDEYERLSKSVDINKRLLKVLETTYSIKDARTGMGENIVRAIKSMATSIKLQEERLNQIRSQFSDVFEVE
ncbi:MAG TPA: response regulator [Candidatus Methanoculleus thermohydrogenotrophicum]|jgi:CheY-like chemotaxis protein|nr:response regulator [Candidatus Methanoculleus thermohydrogenotrophicum]NLM81621.1 response regulator [Candidatus Methanoculleus thermohydrogenotrophicum]HOB17126.1 response regulator [Candidatus Methanoculleus thermohydrogenotrophicum]HPZ37206.1 response regulator [Candidatus Methanoculleus thermohydrogenotrophicum]HQC90579.1 response regulator [Candidatus Methanoculleus thermohydrogenotrophicum]